MVDHQAESYGRSDASAKGNETLPPNPQIAPGEPLTDEEQNKPENLWPAICRRCTATVEYWKQKAEAAQAEIDEMIANHRRVLDDARPKDEQHCSCCGELRLEIERLKAEKAELELLVNNLSGGNYAALRGELGR